MKKRPKKGKKIELLLAPIRAMSQYPWVMPLLKVKKNTEVDTKQKKCMGISSSLFFVFSRLDC